MYSARIITYQLDSCLAALLDGKDERLLKTSLGLVKGEESLVRSLCCLVLGGCQKQLERVGRAKVDLLAEACIRRESDWDVLALR